MDPVVRQSLRTGRVPCKFRDPSFPIPVDGAVFCKHRRLKLWSGFSTIDAQLGDLLPPDISSGEDELGFCITLYYKRHLPDGRVVKDEGAFPINFWLSSESLRNDVATILNDRQINPQPRPLFRQFQTCVGGALGNACASAPGVTGMTGVTGMLPMRRKSCPTPKYTKYGINEETELMERHEKMGVLGSVRVEEWLSEKVRVWNLENYRRDMGQNVGQNIGQNVGDVGGGGGGGRNKSRGVETREIDMDDLWGEVSDFGVLKKDFTEQCFCGLDEERFGWFLIVQQDESGKVSKEVFRDKNGPFLIPGDEVRKYAAQYAVGGSGTGGGGNMIGSGSGSGGHGSGHGTASHRGNSLPRDHHGGHHGAGQGRSNSNTSDHSATETLNLFGFRHYLCNDRNTWSDETLAEGVLGVPKSDQKLSNFFVSTAGPRSFSSLDDLSFAVQRYRCLSFFFMGAEGGQVLLVPGSTASTSAGSGGGILGIGGSSGRGAERGSVGGRISANSLGRDSAGSAGMSAGRVSGGSSGARDSYSEGARAARDERRSSSGSDGAVNLVDGMDGSGGGGGGGFDGNEVSPPIRIPIRDFVQHLIKAHKKYQPTHSAGSFPLSVVLLHPGPVPVEVENSIRTLCHQHENDMVFVNDSCRNILTSENRVVVEISPACADPYLLSMVKPVSLSSLALTQGARENSRENEGGRRSSSSNEAGINNRKSKSVDNKIVSSSSQHHTIFPSLPSNARSAKSSIESGIASMITIPFQNGDDRIVDPTRLWQRGVHRVCSSEFHPSACPETAIFGERGFCALQHSKQLKAWNFSVTPVLIEKQVPGLDLFYGGIEGGEEGIGGAVSSYGRGAGGSAENAGGRRSHHQQSNNQNSTSSSSSSPYNSAALYNDNTIHSAACENWLAHGSKRTLTVSITVKSAIHLNSERNADTGPNCFDPTVFDEDTNGDENGNNNSPDTVRGLRDDPTMSYPTASYPTTSYPLTGRSNINGGNQNHRGNNGTPDNFCVRTGCELKLKCPYPESSIVLIEIKWTDPLTGQALTIAHACHRLLSIRPGLRWVSFPCNIAVRGVLVWAQIN